MYHVFGNHIYSFSPMTTYILLLWQLLIYYSFGRHVSFSLFMPITFEVSCIFVYIQNTNTNEVLGDSHKHLPVWRIGQLVLLLPYSPYCTKLFYHIWYRVGGQCWEGRCLNRLFNHPPGWGKDPQGSGVGTCLTRVVKHPQGLGRILQGAGWINVSLGWSSTPWGWWVGVKGSGSIIHPVVVGRIPQGLEVGRCLIQFVIHHKGGGGRIP